LSFLRFDFGNKRRRASVRFKQRMRGSYVAGHGNKTGEEVTPIERAVAVVRDNSFDVFFHYFSFTK